MLKRGDIIIAKEDIISQGDVFNGFKTAFYIYKGKKYKLKNYVVELGIIIWYIELTMKAKYVPDFLLNHGRFTEEELFQNFDCIRYQRKEKINKLNNILK